MKLFKVRLFKYFKRGLLLLFLIPLTYLGFQVYFALQSGYITQIAVEHELSESISTVGIAVREEMLVEETHSGYLHYIPEEGERITKDSVIAYVFNDIETAENNVQLLRYQEELDSLIRSVDIPENVINDIANLSRQQNESYYSLLNVSYSGQLENIHTPVNTLIESFNKLQLAMEIECDISDEVARLESTISSLQRSTIPINTITSPEVGYFVRNLDGGEELFDPAISQSWDSVAFTEAVHLAENLTVDQQVTGKIILDYRWDFYCQLPELDSSILKVGEKYDITFSEAVGQVFPAELERIDPPDENGMTLLQFSCNTLTPEVAQIRHTSAQIIIRNYQGIRVSREALHIVDGEKGVYVQFGNLIQFKKIVPIFENEEYMLLPFDSDEENQVKLFDVIIVEGRDLYDGKFL